MVRYTRSLSHEGVFSTGSSLGPRNEENGKLVANYPKGTLKIIYESGAGNFRGLSLSYSSNAKSVYELQDVDVTEDTFVRVSKEMDVIWPRREISQQWSYRFGFIPEDTFHPHTSGRYHYFREIGLVAQEQTNMEQVLERTLLNLDVSAPWHIGTAQLRGQFEVVEWAQLMRIGTSIVNGRKFHRHQSKPAWPRHKQASTDWRRRDDLYCGETG